MLDRAFATLELKSVDLDLREIDGIATTPSTDRRGDIVECGGALFTLPLPLLWQHNQAEPVGEVVDAQVTPTGIRIKARFAKVEEPGALRDRLDTAWQSVKARLVRGLSIGFTPIEAVPVKKSEPYGSQHIKRWQWAELSAVTIPMNQEATITNIKAASGPHSLPGDAGASPRPPMQTYSEQITAHETSRAAAVASMTDLMTAAGNENLTLTPEQTKQYDESALRVKSIDAHIARLRELDALNADSAKPVPPTPTPRTPVVQVKANVPKGTAFVRMACAKLVCNGNMFEAAEYAKRWNDSTPEVALAIKAAVAPGTTTDTTWAAPLVNRVIADDFLELLRPATILGRIPGLRNVPFNCKVPSQTAGGTYGWVGEAKPKPVTSQAFSSETLDITKVAGIVVLTEELVRLSNPSAEALVRDDMIKGIAQFLDGQFINPAVAAVAGVNPASITNGAATAAATTNPLADIMGLIGHFSTYNIPVDGLVFLLSPANALALSFRSNLDGSPQFPGIGINGGSYRGLTFLTSNTVTTNVIALQPALVLYADDGGVTIDASREASLQMDSAPASPADATTVYVSLWQTNCVGLRAERFINWKRIGTNAVKYLTATAWPSPTGETMSVTATSSRGKKDE
jgi:HK97 family phage major capsid protein/HK97 family phage prohead protease